MNNTPKLDNCKIFWKQVLTLSTALNILSATARNGGGSLLSHKILRLRCLPLLQMPKRRGSGYDGQAKMKEDCQSSLLSSLNGTITDAIMLSTISCAKGYHTSQRTLK
nr:MAG TPA: hypothetical protein [Caudoviricetes sp.]